MNVNYLCRFNVDEYLSTHEKVQLSTRVQFSLLVSTLKCICLYNSTKVVGTLAKQISMCAYLISTCGIRRAWTLSKMAEQIRLIYSAYYSTRNKENTC